MAIGEPIAGAVWGAGRNVRECLTEEAMCRNKMTGGWSEPTPGCQKEFAFGSFQRNMTAYRNMAVSKCVTFQNGISQGWDGLPGK